MKVLNGLNETINVVLEYLKDAKVIISIPLTIICFSYTYFCDVQEHGQNKGNDLLASVRVVGRYALCILSHPCLYRAQSRLCQLTNFFFLKKIVVRKEDQVLFIIDPLSSNACFCMWIAVLIIKLMSIVIIFLVMCTVSIPPFNWI